MYNAQLIIDRINYLLERSGDTKTMLNNYCGIDKSTINASATGKNGLGARILYDIGDFFHCSVDYLLGRTDVISVADHETLTPDEADLLAAFRAMSEKDQQRLIGRAQAIAEAEKTAERKEA